MLDTNFVLTVYNGTPHDINIIEGAVYDEKTRKYYGGNIVNTIPSDGQLNARYKDLQPIGINHNIPIYKRDVNTIDACPNHDMVIVSVQYATAYKEVHGNKPNNLYTIVNPVYDVNSGTIIGCLGVQKV